MSHVVKINLEIKDLDALSDACKSLGIEFERLPSMGNIHVPANLNPHRYEWWGTSVGDYPLPQGMTKEQLGTCAHRINVKGTSWQIGIFQTAPGKYTPVFDFYGSWGKPLEKAIGHNGEKLKQAYAIAAAKRAALQKGLSVQTFKMQDGSVKLVMTGGAI